MQIIVSFFYVSQNTIIDSILLDRFLYDLREKNNQKNAKDRSPLSSGWKCPD